MIPLSFYLASVITIGNSIDQNDGESFGPAPLRTVLVLEEFKRKEDPKMDNQYFSLTKEQKLHNLKTALGQKEEKLKRLNFEIEALQKKIQKLETVKN